MSFVRLLTGVDTSGNESDKLSLSVSLKLETISPKFPGTVRMLLPKRIKILFMCLWLQTDVMKPINLEAIMDEGLETLSGGELRRVAIVLALGKYLEIPFLYSSADRLTGMQMWTSTFLSSQVPSWTLGSVSFPERLSSDSSYMQRRLHLLLSSISS
jgi:hypothetical protein